MFDLRQEPPSPQATELADVPLELIEREIESLAARITAGNARWLELVAEFDRREGWANTGCRSTCEWVAWRCALNPRSAREQVRVARALAGVPLIGAAFARGELSYSKTRALTRIADNESEADLLELARNATAAQLERIVRAARRTTATEADEAQRESYVRWEWDDDDGSLRIDAKLAPENGALFLRALESARDQLGEQFASEARERRGGSAEPLDLAEQPPPPPSPTNAQSFATLCENALARADTGRNGGDRYQVLVHVDAETLTTDLPGASATGRGKCALADGPGIAAETARRLACDASLVPIIERDGEPLSVGRRRRSIPPAIRRALAARDGCCQFPGCDRRRFVDAHHIHHWAHGGETAIGNLILLCTHHHRLVHEGGFSLSLDGRGRPVFKDSAGATVPRSPRPPYETSESGPFELAASASIYTGSGENMDLRSCVDAAVDALVPSGRGRSRPDATLARADAGDAGSAAASR